MEDKISINVNLDLDIDDLTTIIHHLSDDELFDFIANIDNEVADWEFTEKLYKHFNMLHKQYLKG